MLQVGTRAPDAGVFRAPGEPARLRAYYGNGPVVLLFFPLAFSGTCTREVCSMAEDYGAYRELGAEVLGISVDSPYVNRAFAASCNADFPILSDWHREASAAFGVLRPDLNGLRDVSERASFVIAPDGAIAYAWQGEHPGVMPDFDAIRSAVERAAR
jgi:glutaredoxin-dependent peroxiredoxin